MIDTFQVAGCLKVSDINMERYSFLQCQIVNVLLIIEDHILCIFFITYTALFCRKVFFAKNYLLFIMAKEATLSWMVGNETHYRILFLEDGKLLLSSHFLQGLLPLTIKFVTLHGILQYGEILWWWEMVMTTFYS